MFGGKAFIHRVLTVNGTSRRREKPEQYATGMVTEYYYHVQTRLNSTKSCITKV